MFNSFLTKFCNDKQKVDIIAFTEFINLYNYLDKQKRMF
jgi:hypothetical protein